MSNTLKAPQSIPVAYKSASRIGLGPVSFGDEFFGLTTIFTCCGWEALLVPASMPQQRGKRARQW